MPELPEIYHLRDQLNIELSNKQLSHIRVIQPKATNLDQDTFSQKIRGRVIGFVSAKGKWLFIHLDMGHKIAINLGMGGEISLVEKPLEKKHQVELNLSSNQLLNIRFWWFGYVHFLESGVGHDLTDKLGIDYLSEGCTLDYFAGMLKHRRGSLKNFLLNQHHISGLGNYYIHDILFLAGLHPLRTIPSLSRAEIENLYHSIQKELKDAYQQNGSDYEEDLYQTLGRFKADKVAYREGHLCGVCHHTIEKIKTGQTTSYFCPHCQK